MLNIFLTSFQSYKFKFYLILILFGSFIAAFLEMLGLSLIPLFVTFLIDANKLNDFFSKYQFLEFLNKYSYSNLVFILSGFIVMVYILKNTYLSLLIYFECRFFRNFKKYLANIAFFSYINYPYDFHLKNNPSYLIRNVTSEVAALSTYLQSVITIIREMLILFFLMILLISVDPIIMILVIVLLTVISSIFYVFVRQELRVRGEKAQYHRGNMIKIVSEGLYAIREVKVFNRISFYLSKFTKEINGAEYNEAFRQIISAMPKLFLEVCAVTAVLLVTVSFVLLNRPFDEMLPILSLLGITIVRMVPSITSLTTQMTLIRYYTASAKIIVKEINNFNRYKITDFDKNNDKEELNFKNIKKIEIKNINFEYKKNERLIENLSISINENESIGIIGSSGAGKSTLINLILGLLKPKKGKIIVNDINIEDQINAWRKIIGYVPQDIYLSDDTIINNIGFGLENKDIDKDRVFNAIKLAKLDEFILSLEDGLDTFIGDRGIRISGGQKQRIGIARALYNNPKVLIIDEGTSSLDQKTEQLLIDEINTLNRNRIIIFVSHRLVSLSNCDRLYYLQDGQIIAKGNYNDIINNKDLEINKIRKN